MTTNFQSSPRRRYETFPADLKILPVCCQVKVGDGGKNFFFLLKNASCCSLVLEIRIICVFYLHSCKLKPFLELPTKSSKSFFQKYHCYVLYERTFVLAHFFLFSVFLSSLDRCQISSLWRFCLYAEELLPRIHQIGSHQLIIYHHEDS